MQNGQNEVLFAQRCKNALNQSGELKEETETRDEKNGTHVLQFICIYFSNESILFLVFFFPNDMVRLWDYVLQIEMMCWWVQPAPAHPTSKRSYTTIYYHLVVHLYEFNIRSHFIVKYWLSQWMLYWSDRHTKWIRDWIDDRFFALGCLPFSSARQLSSTSNCMQTAQKAQARTRKTETENTMKLSLCNNNIMFILSNRKCQQNPVWFGLRWVPSLLIIHIATVVSSIDHAM